MAAVCIVVAAVFAIGSLLSSKIINASKYQKLLDVETRSFKDDIKEVVDNHNTDNPALSPVGHAYR